MNILKRTTDDDDVDDDDDDDDDLLSEGDLEDDCEVDCYDEEDVLDSKLYCSSTPVVESRSPLRPETTSPSSSWNRRGSSNYQRELLLDGGFDEMARLLAKFQLDDRTEDDDDVLSEGDVESCYGDDEDDQEDDFDDGDSDYDSNGSHQNHLFVISE
ncbi:hypothetical protein IV203_002598 [Nitzschia inconspicua]|nr:hypothetical protein IV203_002598 [Nitzschia inconspicua]